MALTGGNGPILFSPGFFLGFIFIERKNYKTGWLFCYIFKFLWENTQTRPWPLWLNIDPCVLWPPWLNIDLPASISKISRKNWITTLQEVFLVTSYFILRSHFIRRLYFDMLELLHFHCESVVQHISIKAHQIQLCSTILCGLCVIWSVSEQFCMVCTISVGASY